MEQSRSIGYDSGNEVSAVVLAFFTPFVNRRVAIPNETESPDRVSSLAVNFSFHVALSEQRPAGCASPGVSKDKGCGTKFSFAAYGASCTDRQN